MQSQQGIVWLTEPIALPGTTIKVLGYDTVIGPPAWLHQTDTDTTTEGRPYAANTHRF